MKSTPWRLALGANFDGSDSTHFKVWSPGAANLRVKIVSPRKASLIPMEKDNEGYFHARAEGVFPSADYVYVIDGVKERPDPVSRFQPSGVHGPSQVVDPARFKWTDRKWPGIVLKDTVYYEIHVGTFTKEGTFDAAIQKIPYLKKLGVTCLQLMPVAQFPGERNWGYDGVYPYAVQNSYGGPEGLRRLVNACHAAGMGVSLDVIYNHLGPEGCYARDFGPYFTSKYHTPWGDGINFDEPYCGPVRRYILDNLLYWITEFHVDAFRLDATDWLCDFSVKHIMQEITEELGEISEGIGKPVRVVAENDQNNSRIIRPLQDNGYGMDAQWSDDFHHALHVLLTGEKFSYYQDFSGLRDLAKSIRDGFVYDGQYSEYRKRQHGSSSRDLPGDRFVVCIQNHDQVGNRIRGDRFGETLSFEAQKLAAAALILSPFVPLIFMGQEYGEKNPFYYFVDHEDAKLVKAVRNGRRQTFISLGLGGDIKDPKGKATFLNSKLEWARLHQKESQAQWSLYRDLIALKRSLFSLHRVKKETAEVDFSEEDQWLSVRFPLPHKDLALFLCFSDRDQTIPLRWRQKGLREILNTESGKYGGSLPERRRVYSNAVPCRARSAIAGELIMK